MPGRHVAVLVNSRHVDTPYDRWVAGTDVALTLLVSERVAEGYRHVAAPHRVLTFEDYRTNGNVELAVLELHRERPIEVLVARSEPDILRSARLRGLLGLPGQDWASALAFRDKLEMKRHVAGAGIPVPAHAPLECGADLCAFVEEHGYPVVVKPVRGSGSLDTDVLATPAALAARLAAGVDGQYMAERFVEGAMFTVDGIVVDGVPRVLAASRYVNDCLSFQRGEFLGHVLLPGEAPLQARLAGFAQQVLAAMPVPPATTVHLEVWRTPADQLVFCEVASRTGGIRIGESLSVALGVDLDREWFAAQVGLPLPELARPPLNPARPGTGHLVLYPADGVLAGLPQGRPPAGVVSQHVDGRPGQRFHGGYKSGDYLAAFVVRGDDEHHVEERLHEVAAWFGAGCRWEREAAA